MGASGLRRGCECRGFRWWSANTASAVKSKSSYALFDDAGKFIAGRVMSEADASAQIELDSGKRVKVKSANVLLRFAKPEPAALVAAARAGGPGDLALDDDAAQRLLGGVVGGR